MPTKTVLGILLLFLPLQSFGLAQNGMELKQKSEALSPVQLLPGYKLQIVPGVEGSGGTIWKRGGPTIGFNLPQCCFGNIADSIESTSVLWRQEQIINGQKVICVFTKSHELVITFPKSLSNFQANVRNQQELAEILLMVLTYDPYKGYQVDPSAVEPTPVPNKR
jgi:hypothetical protein